jgi:hypothetical protein
LYRLTSASDSGGWSRTFNYDQAGNMWVTNPVGGPWSGSTPTANAFTNNRINGTSYDLSGNQLVVNGDTLAYDAENRQSAAMGLSEPRPRLLPMQSALPDHRQRHL